VVVGEGVATLLHFFSRGRQLGPVLALYPLFASLAPLSAGRHRLGGLLERGNLSIEWPGSASRPEIAT